MNIFESHTSLKSFTHFPLFLRWDLGTLCAYVFSLTQTVFPFFWSFWTGFSLWNTLNLALSLDLPPWHSICSRKGFPHQLPLLHWSHLLHSRSHLGHGSFRAFFLTSWAMCWSQFYRPVALWFFPSVIHHTSNYMSNAFLFQQNVRTVWENLCWCHSFFEWHKARQTKVSSSLNWGINAYLIGPL